MLRAAVIGLGRMGAEPSSRLEGKIPNGWLPISHVEALQTLEGVQLIGLCDNYEVRLRQIADYYQVEQIYTDYKDLIDNVRPDILCIATRTEGRTNIIKYACSMGVKIIYSEKPFSRTITDCSDVLALVKYHKVILGYGVNRRYHVAYRKAKEIINSGVLGEINEIIIEHGRSNLYWTHPHSIDNILFFSGSTEIESLQATCTFNNEYYPSDSNFIDDDPIVENAFFIFKNGIRASINQTSGWNTRIACSQGILTVFADGTSINIRTGTGGYFNNSEDIVIQPSVSATITALTELITAYKNTTQSPISPEEIYTGMVILNGIVYSHLNGGKLISLSEVPLDMNITGKSGSLYA